MDRKISQSPEVERLIRLTEASRLLLDREVSELKHRLDLPARVRDSLKSHPSAWLLGSLASGFVGSAIFRRKPVSAGTKRRGLAVTLLGLALTAARPFAKVWLADKVKGYLTGKTSGFADHPPRSFSAPNPPI